MSKRLIYILFLFGGIAVLQGCECSNSSSHYSSPSTPYYPQAKPVLPPSNTLSSGQLQELLKQLEQNHPVTQPRQRIQRTSSDWDRGYDYGWEAGYEDAINGNGAWASYDDYGKGGDFLDGYESGYIDGYENGRDDRDEDDEEIEEL